MLSLVLNRELESLLEPLTYTFRPHDGGELVVVLRKADRTRVFGGLKLRPLEPILGTFPATRTTARLSLMGPLFTSMEIINMKLSVTKKGFQYDEIISSRTYLQIKELETSIITKYQKD